MNKPISSANLENSLDWNTIDTVMLDMDGTLLDKHFDDYFWEKYVPQKYADRHGLSAEQAEQELLAKYRSVENTLQWTDLNYWSDRLGLDIAQLKRDINHMIRVHDGVVPFLRAVRATGKRLFLVTNAHSKTLEIKLDRAEIGGFFDTIICAEEVGEAKEQLRFWERLAKHLSFDSSRTLFADDTEKVLRSARDYGIRYLIHVAKPSSQLAIRYSSEFPSIKTFHGLTDSLKLLAPRSDRG